MPGAKPTAGKKGKKGKAKAAAAEAPTPSLPPASAPAPPSSPAALARRAEEEEEDAKAEWATLQMKVVDWEHGSHSLVLKTSTPLAAVRRLLEERHGPFARLCLYRDEYGQPGHELPPRDLDWAATLADCGLRGRRRRRRQRKEGKEEEDETEPPVVWFVYYDFKPAATDPLLLYEAAGTEGTEPQKEGKGSGRSEYVAAAAAAAEGGK